MKGGALIALGLVMALAGCSTQPMRDLRDELREFFRLAEGGSAFRLGLRQYNSGQYENAARSLQTALELGLSDADTADAHKHLAFINCAAQRERACRDEFRRALRADSQLELTPAEAGHPVWGPIFASLKGASPFKIALQQYEAGDYDESAKGFEGALRQGLGDRERASAHKHLAFIHCAAQRERQCRDEFRKALAADPALELEPAEAGHPVWGPVFRAVKAGR
jgi:Tfp pilus assembly protein PilF